MVVSMFRCRNGVRNMGRVVEKVAGFGLSSHQNLFYEASAVGPTFYRTKIITIFLKLDVSRLKRWLPKYVNSIFKTPKSHGV